MPSCGAGELTLTCPQKSKKTEIIRDPSGDCAGQGWRTAAELLGLTSAAGDRKAHL